MLPYINIFNKVMPMYGVCFVSAILLAAVNCVFMCKRRGILWENSIIIGITGVGFGLLFAKLLYILVTYTLYDFIAIFHSGRAAELFSGGFVFYGGVFGGIAGAVVGARLADAELSEYQNILILQLPLAHALGRIGCFCAGCCYGRPTESFIGVIYTKPLGSVPIGIPLFPIQLFEAGFNIVVFAILLLAERKTKKSLLPHYLLLYATGRFVLEYYRYDAERGGVGALSTSQIISLLLMIISIITFVAASIQKQKRK